ncbi:RagB/SusD family nutrient uptake outer membrane protein [Myroides odoratimimus]|uniref:RagB/SusD family nutrient uptake outer membrane protein n=1 Tax=Myroides odoratimimus TaxID=76832 RepID=UPI0038D353CC
MKKYLYSSLVLGSLLMLGACSDDFTENSQTDGVSGEVIEQMGVNPELALSMANNIGNSTQLIQRKSGVGSSTGHADFGQKSIEIMMDGMSNDVMYKRYNWFTYSYNYDDRLESYDTSIIYNYFTRVVNTANRAISLVVKSQPTKFQDNPVYARALGIRGYAYLYLIQLYGYDGDGVPTQIVDADGNIVDTFSRASIVDVNKMIERDLLQSYDVLKSIPNAATKEQLNKNIVAGILSRYYLYVENFAEAKRFAELALDGNLTPNSFEVVNNGTFAELNNLDWMWGANIDGGRTTTYASYFSHMDSFNVGYGKPSDTEKSVDRRLYDGMNATDKRKVEWFADGTKRYYSVHWKEVDANGKPVGKVLPKYLNTKFRDVTAFLGDYSYMRKTEMFFNYMEAAYRLGDEGTALRMLKEYMQSRDDKYAANLSGEELFKEIQKQKRIEFWGEGFGLLDMKRWKVGLERDYEGTNHTLDGGVLNIKFPSAKFTYQFPIHTLNASNGALKQNPVG